MQPQQPYCSGPVLGLHSPASCICDAAGCHGPGFGASILTSFSAGPSQASPRGLVGASMGGSDADEGADEGAGVTEETPEASRSFFSRSFSRYPALIISLGRIEWTTKLTNSRCVNFVLCFAT